jgi:VanZ family protein
MKANKILLGGLAGTVTILLFSWLFYVILLKNYMAANLNQSFMRPMEDQVVWAMILANLGLGFLLAIVCSWTNTKGIIAGLKVGVIIGVLVAVYLDFTWHFLSTMFINTSAVLVDIIVNTVTSAIGGGVIGLIMDTGKKDA